jgi:hypothetical protein
MKKLPGIMPPENEERRREQLKQSLLTKLRSSASTDEASTILPGSDDDGVMSDGSNISDNETQSGSAALGHFVMVAFDSQGSLGSSGSSREVTYFSASTAGTRTREDSVTHTKWKGVLIPRCSSLEYVNEAT